MLGGGKRARLYTLGFRQPDFTGTLNDFLHYYERLRDFFSNPYAAHAALRKGGIIWRIAVMVLEDRYRWDEADHTVDLWSHGEVLEVERGRYEYLDEGTIEEEDEFIVGTYKVYTDIGPEQTATRSWFPKHTTWTGSPYDVGYWTPKAERWFQQRLQHILTGVDMLKTATEWRRSLYRSRSTIKLTQKVESASRVFIDEVLRGTY
ncbi:hypothetical protein K474DRAFT_1610050 [Panus rudis PR-1116 ss-1]|nr:hypothetical protein K474DRAFT_1610050 [Panus rudis PR-1116 ss-1]